MSTNDDYTEIKDLLDETQVDLEYVESNLSESEEDIEKALNEASKKFEKNFKSLAKKAKKEIRSEELNFYHDNKKVVNADLKAINVYVKDILKAIKDDLNEEIGETVDKDEKKALKKLRSKVKKTARRYNRKYAMLKVKLAVGNAGVDIKNFFS